AVSIHPRIRSSSGYEPGSLRADNHNSAGTAAGRWGGSPACDFRCSFDAALVVRDEVERSSLLGRSSDTTTLSGRPSESWIFPSDCQRGVGSPGLVRRWSVTVAASTCKPHSSCDGAQTWTVASPANPGSTPRASAGKSLAV